MSFSYDEVFGLMLGVAVIILFVDLFSSLR